MANQESCEHCGSGIDEDRRSDARHCDDLHRVYAWRAANAPELPSHCEGCGNPLPDVQRSTKRYCSPRCRSRAHRGRLRAGVAA